MSITQAILAFTGPPHFPDDPRKCRQRMRHWSKRWREHARHKDQFQLAELCLGNAIGWRDRGDWAVEEAA